MSASRNLGARHARGKYIAFLEADDVWLEHKTREQVEIFAQHDQVGMVYGKTQIWHSWAGTETLKPDFFYDLGVATNQKYPAGRLLANLVENKFQTPTTCNAMIRRDAYWRVGGFEDSFTGMYEDQAFFAKLYCKWPTFVAENYWARYRQHAGNAPEKFCKINYLKERKELLGFVSRYARTHPNTLDQPTRAVLRTERLRTLFPRVTDYLERRGTHRLGRKD